MCSSAGASSSQQSCFAYELGPNERCELHWDPISYADSSKTSWATQYVCWLRASETPTPGPTSAPTTPAPTFTRELKQTTLAPTPATSTLAPTSPEECVESAEQQSIKIDSTVYTGNCAAFVSNNWCAKEEVSSVCPISCGKCVPEGCEDDPGFSIQTGQGLLTCKDWEGYTCWDTVVEKCPTACGLPQCTR